MTSNPPPPTSLADVNDDPAEVDLGVQNPLSLLAGTDPSAQNPFAAFGAGAGGGAPGEDPFSQMMQQMMAGMGGAGGPGGPGGIPGGQQQQPAADSPFAPAPPKTLLDRFFPLVHITSMAALAIYVVFVYEPAKRMAACGWAGGSEGVDWSAWSALLTHKPRDLALGASAFRGLASVVSAQLRVGARERMCPLTTVSEPAAALDVCHSRADLADDSLVPRSRGLSLICTIVDEDTAQLTRTRTVGTSQNRPAPPGILNSILPLISQFSPQIGLAIQTGVRYLDLFSTCLNDLAVLIFCIGLTVVIGRWKAGPPTGLVQAVEEKVNEALNRAAGDL